jgi:cobalt/nickel transport protein
MKNQNVMLLILVVLLAAVPLMMNTDGKFSGADDQFVEMVKDIHPDYEPWFKNIWEPPSGEVESFLFAVQAGLGAGFLGYFFGYYQGRNVSKREETKPSGGTANAGER